MRTWDQKAKHTMGQFRIEAFRFDLAERRKVLKETNKQTNKLVTKWCDGREESLERLEKPLLSSSQRVTMCLKWFKFNCMNSLKMNWNCNYRMNLQDTECLKFFSRIHVARTTGCQERSSDRATPWSTFITHCLKLSDAQRSMFRSPKRLWNLVWFASSDFKTAHFYS